MDEIDILITKELAADPRLPYRDLADRLSLSVNAVHKRIQTLMARGVILGFRTQLTPCVTGGGIIALYGRSMSTDFSATMEAIGGHACTNRIIAAGGQFLYVDALVRTNEEAHEYQTFVREVGRFDDLKVIAMFILGPAPLKDPMTKMDYRIVQALSADCRRPLQEVAGEVGSTAKTVKRRLDHMVEQHLVMFILDWVPCSSGDLISIVHAKLRPGKPLQEVIPTFVNRKDPHILGISASNIDTSLMVFSIWSRDLRELREAEASLNSGGDFDSMYSNLYYDMRLYPTWMKKFIADRSK